MPESSSEPSRPSVSSEQADDMVDHTIGEFRLLRRLGAGGMAEVYLAEQPSLNRVVALKILRPGGISGFDQSFLYRFEREAQAAGQLSHPHIVQVYQTGHHDDVHYIVQEYVPGQNLAQQIRRQGPPGMVQGLEWMRQIAEALRSAHRAGIVHRDIKPENILLTRSGDVKIADFGLAQLTQANEQTSLTQTGTTMGTPLYMSPEQIRGMKVDHRSDQYAFGITCYHMFAGQPPFTAANSVSVAVRHLQDTAVPLSNHRADLPRQVVATIHRMMAREPEQRYQTPDELLDAIQALQSLPANTRLQQSSGLIGRLRSMVPGVRASLTGLLVATLLGFGAGWMWLRSPGLPPPPPLEYPRMDNAAEQFAAAILDADNETGWLAVAENYPNTPESRMAQMHLALLYLTRVAPAPELADRLLSDLADEALTRPDEQDSRRLRIQALAGRAIAARQLDRREEERELRSRIPQEFTPEEIEDTLASSPRVLQLYGNTFRSPPPP